MVAGYNDDGGVLRTERVEVLSGRPGVETRFNVFEILQIAEQVEHKSATFYLKAAELFADADLRDVLYRLAAWKARHEKLWARMRKRFSEKTGEFGTFDPDNYVLSNPQVMSGLTGLGVKQDGAARLTGKENKRQILSLAIRRANEGVIFYGGLKDFARDPASKDAIDQIIRAENRQIQFLLNELKQR